MGAFPGAIPFMLGWVAVTGNFGIEPGLLFMIQFFWQFPAIIIIIIKTIISTWLGFWLLPIAKGLN